MSDASEQRHWARNEPEPSGRCRDWEVEGVKGVCRRLASVWEGALGVQLTGTGGWLTCGGEAGCWDQFLSHMR